MFILICNPARFIGEYFAGACIIQIFSSLCWDYLTGRWDGPLVILNSSSDGACALP